jgi:translation initiation factor 2 subunit 3
MLFLALKKIKKSLQRGNDRVASENLQPEISIGMVGHIDHGKTTLLSRLSAKWTDTHSEELKKGITIRLGYADATFYKCKCKGSDAYGSNAKCDKCQSSAKPLRKVSFIDAPGHETLMATMLSGAAIMDAAILLVAANEECPQPQTEEHLMALDIVGIKNIVIVQNKIDLVSAEDAKKNYEAIKKFVKGTVAENAPIIPVSAQHNVNVGAVIEAIETNFKTPKRDKTKTPIMYVARSFDVNKPGSEIAKLSGGVLGGSLKQGVFKVGDKIEIKPGREASKGKWEPIETEIGGIFYGGESVKEASPGGSMGIQTKLDPFYVKGDSLTGAVVGKPGSLPETWYEFDLKPKMLNRIVDSKEEVKPIAKGEALMLNVNSATTVGIVKDLKKGKVSCVLKLPICASKEDRIAISRRFGTRWKLIGVANIV